MKSYFLKLALSVVLASTVGAALAIPPPPPAPTVNVYVQNNLATQYTVTGVMGYCTSPDVESLASYGQVSYSGDTYCEDSSVSLTVQDKANNTCSASANPAWGSLSVTTNPNPSAGWACYASGSTLKVEPVSTKK